jgi:hypothetical protein
LAAVSSSQKIRYDRKSSSVKSSSAKRTESYEVPIIATDDENECEDYIIMIMRDDDDDGDTVCGPCTHGFSILSHEWISRNLFFTLRYIQHTYKLETMYRLCTARRGGGVTTRCIGASRCRDRCVHARDTLYMYIYMRSGTPIMRHCDKKKCK